MYFFIMKASRSEWLGRAASARAQVVETEQPKYVTVLDVSEMDVDELTPEEQLKLKYQGPFYADWDCPEIEEGIESVKRFVTNLEEVHGVSLDCVRLYATGGRGFHCEIPFEVFSNARSKQVTLLPHIWRELANRLYTEHLDMAVYSAKKGRMWRTPNVERETPGKYKVPITVDELFAMTPESYETLCSAPRAFPEYGPASLSGSLAAMYQEARNRTEQALRDRKGRKNAEQVVKRFGGEWPDSVKRLMAGENLSPDVGLNKVALQLAILSCSLNKDLDAHLEACQGLINSYRGDGHRSARSVRQELTRIYKYIEGNPSFSFSPAAMASIMETNELDTVGTPGADLDEVSRSNLTDLTQGMVNGSNGIYRAEEEAVRRETNWHFDPDSVTEIEDATTGLSRGFVLMGMDSGQHAREVQIDHHTLTSVDKARSFLASQGAAAPRIDAAKAGGMLAVIMGSARRNAKLMAVDKEGLMWVDIGGKGKRRVAVWSSPIGCVSADDDLSFRYRAQGGSEVGNFQSDLYTAPALDELARAPEVLQAMFRLNNNRFTMAAILGWLSACWHKEFHTAWYEAFPLLQLYGESGAGKSAVAMLLMKLFYFRNAPKMINAATGSAYGRRVMFTGSSSIPLYIDEFKPRQMSQEQVRGMYQLMHEVYTPAFQAPRGGGDSSRPGSWQDLVFETKTTPVAFSTEAAVTETAIQERTISAPFDKSYRDGCEDAFRRVSDNKDVLSALGKALLTGALYINPDKLRSIVDKCHDKARERLARRGNTRVVYNIGVVMSGLAILEKTVQHTFPQQYETLLQPEFESMREALLNESNYPSLETLPEIVKVIDFMGALSFNEDADLLYYPRLGFEYAYTENGFDLNAVAFYGRYKMACQQRSVTPLFLDEGSWRAALNVFSAVVDRNPMDSLLKQRDVRAPVYRFDLRKLEGYGVQLPKL